ncbi:MAG: hypothetical protein UY50_C0023G0024 [Parcubacteria group bacterium GW2011_GWA2_49_9]|nr:MAG: hypothetical protein UY50_C0023G0024 [Parcubacteria group bacterium GW2011_GWA2_49_9]
MSELAQIISHAWAHITPKEAAELTPKNDFLNNRAMVDYEYMPTSHAVAIRDDEHALTEEEKHEFFHNRTHRLKQKGLLVDDRNERYRKNMLTYQKLENKQTAALENIAPALQKVLGDQTSTLEELFRRLEKVLKED